MDFPDSDNFQPVDLSRSAAQEKKDQQNARDAMHAMIIVYLCAFRLFRA